MRAQFSVRMGAHICGFLLFCGRKNTRPLFSPYCLHTKWIFQNAPIGSDRNPGPLAAGREPYLIGFVGFEMLIVNPNRESFFPQRFGQLLTSQISIEKEDIDFRLLGRSELLLQFEVPSTRSPQLCFRLPLRY